MDDEVRDCLAFGTYIKYIKTVEKPKQTANAFTVLMSSMATRKQPSEKNGEDNKSKLYNAIIRDFKEAGCGWSPLTMKAGEELCELLTKILWLVSISCSDYKHTRFS